MKVTNLQDLWLDQLRDLYSAEKQLVKALPVMAKAAKSPELRQGFEEHLEQTEGHVQRLEQIFEQLDASPRGKKCAAMEGLIEEGKELMHEDMDDALLDAGLIGAAQKVEHYEIAGYGTVRTWAELLGMNEAVDLLQQTLDEEKETNEKLSELAHQEVNLKAKEGEEHEMVAAGGPSEKRGRNGRSRK
jgi:ferritin-like metal-binding protein YciE